MPSAASFSERNCVVLPDDVEQLKALIAQRDATIETLAAALESLKQQFLNLRRAQFGASSERIAGQAELFIEPVSLPVPPVQTETITYERERRGRPGLPKDLPRVHVEYDLTEAEKDEFETLTRIGEDKSETLDYIPAKLQVIERDIAEEPPDKKCALRQAQSAPVLGEFRSWLEGTLRSILPRSPTAGAIGYALNDWAALMRYLDSGILDIDNNTCERAMRPVAFGRKNFLFVGSDRGGHAAAVAYSLIQTCKLQHIEPFAYLSDVLRHLPSHPINRVAELLPFSWQPVA